ncbi:MAG: ferric reductase-like transmembrane domain-containing protein [Dermatophilaceae bacterium]
MTTSVLWYANRGTGVVLLAVMTLTTVFGVLATRRTTRPTWPRFVTQGLHRTLAGLAVLLLVVHAGSAVVDEYVDIRWWQVLVPVGSSYQPLWLGIGVLALDLLVLVVATSLVRSRLPHRLWSAVHLTAYAAWLAGFVHGIGIGTDSGSSWLIAGYVASGAAVVVAALVRVIDLVRSGRAADTAATVPAGHVGPVSSAAGAPATRGARRRHASSEDTSPEATSRERTAGERRRRAASSGRRRAASGGRRSP